MNENERKDTSKQVLLSVLGVAILIVAVVGISFAAFTYTRAGERENVVKTGAVTMNYTETTRGININNAEPMTEAQALAAYKGDVTSGDGQNYGTAASGNTSESDNVFDFTVSAKIVGNTQIDYNITAVKAVDHSTDTDCDYDAAPTITDGAMTAAASTDAKGAYKDGKYITGSGSDVDNKAKAGYAKCEYVSDADIRLWIGMGKEVANKVIGEDSYTAETVTDAEYVSGVIDLDGDNTNSTNSAAFTALGTATKVGAPIGEMLLVSDKFTSTATRYYRLKMWVNNDYAVDGTQRSYKVKVNVYAKDHDTVNAS